MANEKISQLPVASTSSGSDLYLVVQSGSSKSITFTALQTALTSGLGGVTSVGLTDSTGVFNISGSPITSSGTLTLTSFKSQTQNTFLAAPNGSSGAPTFRAIVSADVPTLNQNTTGTAANITASSNSTLTTLSALSLPYSQLSGSVPTWNQNTTGTAANITASSNSTLTTLPDLSLPGSQVTGDISGHASSDLALSGGTMSGAINMGANQINNLADPSTNQDAMTVNYANQNYLEILPQSALSGPLDLGGNFIKNVLDPMNPQDGATKNYVDTVTTLPDLTTASSLSSVGTITSGTWNGAATSGFSFLASGATYTTPSNITAATTFKFTLVGGGGGAGGTSASSAATSSGGGAGGVIIAFLTGLSPSTGYGIAIGSAGAGGIGANPGNPGTNTTLTVGVTTYTAGGGGGGADAGSGVSGGTGGTVTNGTILIAGQNGGTASGANTPSSGVGGSGMYGSGGAAISVATAAGNNGTGYGAGGGGARGITQNGSNGSPGFILVEWQN